VHDWVFAVQAKVSKDTLLNHLPMKKTGAEPQNVITPQVRMPVMMLETRPPNLTLGGEMTGRVEHVRTANTSTIKTAATAARNKNI
jgi:hypothetical protein